MVSSHLALDRVKKSKSLGKENLGIIYNQDKMTAETYIIVRSSTESTGLALNALPFIFFDTFC